MDKTNSFTISVAGLSIAVNSIHSFAQIACRDFYTDETPAFEINLTQEDIDKERQYNAEDSLKNGLEVISYPDSYLEFIALLRKTADIAASRNAMLMHGSAICVDGKAYIFTAPSGTGKSTHTRLLMKLLGDRAVMINDDKPFLQFGQEITVCGSPWMGKHHIGCNMTAPLAGIFFLSQAKENRLTELAPDACLSLLINQCYRTKKASDMHRFLDNMDAILSQVKLYRLECNMDISAPQLSSSVMID